MEYRRNNDESEGCYHYLKEQYGLRIARKRRISSRLEVWKMTYLSGLRLVLFGGCQLNATLLNTNGGLINVIFNSIDQLALFSIENRGKIGIGEFQGQLRATASHTLICTTINERVVLPVGRKSYSDKKGTQSQQLPVSKLTK